MTKTPFSYRRFIVTGLLVLFSLGFLYFSEQSDTVNPLFQTIVVSIAFFLVIPFLYSKMVLKESLKNMGWQKGNVWLGMFTSILSVALALGTVLLFTRFTSFAEHYRLPNIVEREFIWFILYELVLVSFTALLYEVFFRGLIELLWLRDFGLWAIVIQTGIFVGLLFLSNDVSWQKLPILLFSPLSGVIAYYSRSLWWSWGASWLFFFLTDVFLLVRH